MQEQPRRGVPSRLIPKRPSQIPQEPPALPKQPAFLPAGQPSEQPPALAESRIETLDEELATPPPSREPASCAAPAAVTSVEGDQRSLLAELPTVKSEALRPRAPLDSKNGVSRSPALIQRTALHAKRSAAANAHTREQELLSPYPALVSGRRARKRHLLAWVFPLSKG